jgi:hypothetical protein
VHEDEGHADREGPSCPENSLKHTELVRVWLFGCLVTHVYLVVWLLMYKNNILILSFSVFDTSKIVYCTVGP